MKANLWTIQAETNVHVGNENNSNYGIIDKAIQRDALTALPCINSSSLKGAINEYCSVFYKDRKEDRVRIFGSDKTDKDTKQQKGSVFFFDAQLLYLPEQDDNKLYHYATSETVLSLFKERLQLFNLEYDVNKIAGDLKLNREIEKKQDKEFKELCDDETLPIIARNKLENGLSANLWYEQVLPSKSVLYFFTQGEDKEVQKLVDMINDKTIQIGANATIGYGFCRIKKLF